jgi:hypothetical protein
MELGYSGVCERCQYENRVDSPTKGDMGCFSRETKAIKGNDEKVMYMLETKALYNYQRNKEEFGLSIQIQKWVPQ